MDLGTKIIGHRLWSLDHGDGYLHAIGLTAQAWGRGVNEARCQRSATGWIGGGWATGSFVSPYYDTPQRPKPCDEAPGPTCDCGLYAHHDYEGKVTPGPFVNPASHIPGVIRAWGRMEVHNKGFRAQYAEILALGYNPNWIRSAVDKIKAVARDYEVECLPLDRLVAFGAELGQTIPVEERPKLEPPAPPSTIEKVKPGQSGLLSPASSFDAIHKQTLADLQTQIDRQLGRFNVPINRKRKTA